MKRVVLAIAAILVSVTMSYAQSNNSQVSKEPFAANFEQLNKYLELAPYQMTDVDLINDYFIEMQHKSLRASSKVQSRLMHNAVFGNLKQMKQILTKEQYHKYLTLLNVTINNHRADGSYTLPIAYLADSAQK